MRVKLGPIVSDARNAIGITTFTRFRGTSVIRRRSAPSDPQSAAQLAQRSVMKNLSLLWRQLPADVQAAWPHPNDPNPLTPFQSFCRAILPTLSGAANWGGLYIAGSYFDGPTYIIDSVTLGDTWIEYHGYLSARGPGQTFIWARSGICRDQDPRTPITPSDLATAWLAKLAMPWTIRHEGLTPATDYVIFPFATVGQANGRQLYPAHPSLRRTTLP